MSSRVISAGEIKRALTQGGRIDGSSLVLRRSQPKVVFSDDVLGAHRPPYLLPAYQFEPPGERLPDETEPDEPEHSWGFREFERLSLAARAAMALSEPGASEPAIRAAASAANLDLDAFPIVYAEDILKQLAKVADELGPDQGKRGKVKTVKQLAMRGGLQIIGCKIRSRKLKDGVRLVNARLPISLRFIGCVFDCPLLLAHCHLVSLDVSGSAMRALDATGLRASGSVYLRRTVIRTPVSFSAAHIAGAFNASDAVIAPMGPAILTVPANPDHGILNLSGATIDNEVQLDRARLWGGLSLRGAVFGRSLYLQHAMIMSPMALLEKRLGDLLSIARERGADLVSPQAGKRFSEAVGVACGMASFDRAFAAFLHTPDKPVGVLKAKRDIHQLSPAQAARSTEDSEPLRIEALGKLEIQIGETDRWRNLTARTLMKLSGQAMSSAVRADNLKVDGTLNARGMVSGGQFRMKYASIKGAVRFDGALLRSAGHIRSTVETVLDHSHCKDSLGLLTAETLDALLGLKQNLTKRIGALRAQASTGKLTTVARAGVSKDVTAAEARLKQADTIFRTLSSTARISDHKLRSHLEDGDELLKGAFGTWRFADLWEMLVGAPGSARRVYFNHRWQGVAASSAVDMRDSHLLGDLSFGIETTVEEEPRTWGFRNSSQPVDLYGSVLLQSLSLGGSIIMNRLISHGPELITELIRPLPKSKGSDSWRDKWVSFYFGPETRRAISPPAVVQALMKAPAQRTLQMDQVKVGRDIDFRRSSGLTGIDLENAIIGGDLKFSSSARLAEAQDMDAKERFFLCEGRAVRVGGVVRLRSAKIGGDARLVFDPRNGPFIDASMMSVEGQLEIYPQVGTTSYQPTNPPPNNWDSESGFWLAACSHETATPPTNPMRGHIPGRVCKHCQVVLDAVESRWAWSIDLSRAKTTVFAHAPAAWPDPGALTLDGFAYQQVAEVGPLHPRQLSTEKNNYFQRRRRRFMWREHKLDSILGWTSAIVIVAVLTAFFSGASWRWAAHDIRIGWLADVLDMLRFLPLTLLMVGGALAVNYYLDPEQGSRRRRARGRLAVHMIVAIVAVAGITFTLDWTADWLRPRSAVVLRFIPTISFVAGILILLFGFMTVSRFMQPGWLPSRHFPFIHDRRLKPRAIEYLSRQRVLENRFQWRSAGHPVLETYVRAAKVLRDAGRFISANAVEEQRLRLRTEMLSWRHHGAAKLALMMVDAFSGYGFRLWRATVAIGVIILGVAWIGHLAAVEGFLVRQNPTNAVSINEAAADTLDRQVCSRRYSVGVMYQDCPDFIYAADLLLPFIDLKEADRWKTTIPGPRQKWFRDRGEPWSSLLASIALLWPAFVSVLGLFLTAIVGAAIGSRIEAALARVEE